MASPTTFQESCLKARLLKIEKESWNIPPLFDLLRRLGNVSDKEMYRTFNMGVGMVIVCSS